MSDLVRIHRDPVLTQAAWDVLTTPDWVADHLVQRLPYKLVERKVFRLAADAAAAAIDRFAQPVDSLVRTRVTRLPHIVAVVDALLHIDTRWLLLHVAYQPALPLSGWALLHETQADQWERAHWPNEGASVVPVSVERIAACAALDAAL